MNTYTYRVYGTDDDSYAFGGPYPMGPMFLRTYKARNPQEAIRKMYNRSKKKHLGWRLTDLTARKAK